MYNIRDKQIHTINNFTIQIIKGNILDGSK